EYGMIPEFVGRLPLCATLEPLDTTTLINILTQPRNAIVKQYQKFFRLEGAEVEFTPDALEKIAERALKRDTGARALRAVCEEIMLDMMYKLPELTSRGTKYVIDASIVEGKRSLFGVKTEPAALRRESA
nr:ATP-dependent Clp protease ATP-binding subunit ClpX [Chthoniobacterales bacterium]